MSSGNISSKSIGQRKISQNYKQVSVQQTYTRPAEWMTLPTVSPTEQKIVGLHLVAPDSNFIAMTLAGAYTVNWGDGTTENFAASATASHSYNFDTLANSSTANATVTSFGYKQVIVTITPQASAVLASINLNVRHPSSSNTYSSGFVDLVMSVPYASDIFIGANDRADTRDITMSNLEQFSLLSSIATDFSWLLSSCSSLMNVPTLATPSLVNAAGMFKGCTSLTQAPMFDVSNCTDATSMFQGCTSLTSLSLYNLGLVQTTANMLNGCKSLRSVPLFNLTSCTNTSYMFQGCAALETVPLLKLSASTTTANMFTNCYALQSVPLFDTSLSTDTSNMFANCTALKNVPLLNLSASLNASGMFNGCTTLQTVPLFDTAAVTNMSNMFNGCVSLRTVPLLDLTACTDTSYMFNGCVLLRAVPLLDLVVCTNAAGMFNNCNSLVSGTCVGVKTSIDYTNCKLSANKLNDIYSNLVSIPGKTITVTGNWGTATDSTIVATGKGWTVTG